MIPLSSDGFSPPPMCHCHRFIFSPLFTEPAFRHLLPRTPPPLEPAAAPPRNAPTPPGLQEDHDVKEGLAKSATNGYKGMGDSNITLWQFLLELLVGNRHGHIIQWTNNEGEFKLLDPEHVAGLWGRRKNKQNMTYDKLSRALRYYYDKNIIKKVMGQKFMYKFVSFPEIVKTETKIPFKQKIDTLAQEYGQQVYPHFASYNAASVKSSAEKATSKTLHNDVKTLRDDVKEEPTDLSNQQQTQCLNLNLNLTQSDFERHYERQKRRKVERGSDDGYAEMEDKDSAFTSPSSSSTLTLTSASSHQRSLPLVITPHSVNTSVTITPPSEPNSSASAVSSYKHKPNPLTLNVTAPMHHTLQTSHTSSITHVPLPSPKPMHTHLTTMHTPFVLASPMLGVPGTPLPLHFWSSLSPITTISPRLASNTPAFQFPSSVGSQLTLPNFDGLISPVGTTPSQPGIPVL